MLGWKGDTYAVLAAALICGAIGTARAQDMPAMPGPAPAPSVPAPKTATPPSTVMATPASPATAKLSQAQLDRLVAPIALYPDPLLAPVLMAATYPLQVVEAARWTRVSANRDMGGSALTAALKGKEWDPSVMALLPFPNLLSTMADKLDWTDRLGAAFLAQQQDVMAAVQHLRHAALVAGNLKATPECHCIIQSSGDVIAILPTDTDLVSVPVYNPTVAYGTWADTASPPVAFPLPSGFASAAGVTIGFEPAVEVALYGPFWGWGSVDWPNHRIVVDNARYAAVAPGHPGFAGSVWVHEPTPHRVVVNTHTKAPRAAHAQVRAATAAHEHRLAMARPPRAYGASRYHGLGLPPGTIVPPPPPPHHAALGWPYDDYRRY
jgi:hypothetical protein